VTDDKATREMRDVLPHAREPRVLREGLAYVESPRWHDGRLWFSHWGTEEIVAVDLDGNSEVVGHGPSGLGWRRETDGSQELWAGHEEAPVGQPLGGPKTSTRPIRISTPSR
jgi:hypothetical protein